MEASKHHRQKGSHSLTWGSGFHNHEHLQSEARQSETPGADDFRDMGWLRRRFESLVKAHGEARAPVPLVEAATTVIGL